MRRQQTIYEAWSRENHCTCSGRLKVLSDFLHITPEAIWDSAKNNRLMLREYRVRKIGVVESVPKPLSYQNQEILKCINSGTSHKDIMERFGLTDASLDARKKTLRRRGDI